MGAGENREERRKVFEFLQGSETAVIATSAGDEIRLRMMHLGVDDDLTIYLASMHNDPKIIQLTNNPSLAILASKQDGPVTEAEEVEYTGRAMVIKDEEERKRCLAVTARTSPVVQSLAACGQASVLDCLKIVPTRIKYRKFKEIVQGMPPTVIEFEQNNQPDSDLRLLGMKLRSWWLAIRLNSLAASLAGVVLGGAIAFNEAGRIKPLLFFLTLLAGLAAQAGTNVLNDYWDHHNGSDRLNRQYIRPFSGGSRVIQLGLLTPLEVLTGGAFLCLAALAAGIYLGIAAGPLVYLLMILGLFSGVMYNSLGTNLIRLGLGELVVGLNFGTLLTLGTAYVQTGRISWTAFAASIPVAILIAAVIYINEFPDAEADASSGKNTLVVRWGLRRAAANLKWFFITAYGYLTLGLALGHIPLWGITALLPAPLAFKAALHATKNYNNMIDLAPANGWTATAHLATGLFLALGYVASRLGLEGLVYTLVTGFIFAGIIAWLTRYTDRLRAASIAVKERFS